MKARKQTRRKKTSDTFADVTNFEMSAEDLKDFEESGPHAYDKADWHLEGKYPKGLKDFQANVHTGMFVGWLIEMNMITKEFLPWSNRFKKKLMTGAQVYENWGGVLSADQLTEEGNQFALHYYDHEFAQDYHDLLIRDLPSWYHVKDSWKNYQLIKRRIDERYLQWKKGKTKLKQLRVR